MKTKTIFLQVIAVLLFSNLAAAEVVEKIVAIVNDQVVTLTDLNQYKKRLKSGGLVDDALLKLGDKKVLLKNKKALVDHLVNERILDSEVKKQELTMTVEKVEQEVRSITKRNQISRSQLKKALGKKGVKFSDYQDFIKTSLERQSLIEKEVTSKIKVSNDEITSYYLKTAKNPKDLVFTYNLSHIMFLPKNGGKSGARKRAERIHNKLKLGASFKTLASQFSEDPRFSQGGFLGELKFGELSKEFRAAVADLEEGQSSKIVESSRGLHILKVNKKTLLSDPLEESEKVQIRNVLFAKAFERQFRNWLDQKRQEAYVRIN